MKLTRYKSFKELKSDTKTTAASKGIQYKKNMEEFKDFINAARKKLSNGNTNKNVVKND